MEAKLAQDIMNRDVLSVRQDMSVRELSGFLIDREISGAPVEDSEGRLVGVVSVTDIARATSSRKGSPTRDQSNPDFFVRGWEDRLEIEELTGFYIDDQSMTVGEIMTAAVYTVDQEMPIPEVARIMVESHLHRLLATREGKVVGIITTSDLLSLLV